MAMYFRKTLDWRDGAALSRPVTSGDSRGAYGFGRSAHGSDPQAAYGFGQPAPQPAPFKISDYIRSRRALAESIR